jgi:hypothetical protein
VSDAAPVRSTFCGVLRAASTNCGARRHAAIDPCRDELLYVGLARATTELIVIAPPELVRRLGANWVAARYGLPLFVRLRRRPAALLYAGAAALSVRGNHTPMVGVFHALLREHLTGQT